MNRRRFLTVAGASVAVASGIYGAYTSFYRDRKTRDGWLLSGVTPSRSDLRQLTPFEQWLRHEHAVVIQYFDIDVPISHVQSAVHGQLANVWEQGYVPQVIWQPNFDTIEGSSPEVNREIAEGNYDDTIETWAETLAEWAIRSAGTPDRRLYLNLAPEMNGDWSPWSPAISKGTEKDFVKMWRHIHDIVMGTDLASDHIQWIWTIDTTTRNVNVQDCYPGDQYVDWVGVHGYNWDNWGGWDSPSDLYGSTIETLHSITDRPVAVTEFGCSSEYDDGYDVDRKDRWIRDAYEYFAERDVRMACWFNFDDETDWAIFGGERGTSTITTDGTEYNVYNGYKQTIEDPGILGPHPDHLRLLTDREFSGAF